MAKPFLKWAGGKKWFISREASRLPHNYNRYIEPFLGGASVFFYMNPEVAILSDINQELINTYIALRDEFPLVYKNLKTHEKNNCQEYFYSIRNRMPRTKTAAAARTIYLNKACFNGIYRVNKNGYFNVPYGTERKIIFDKQKLEEASHLLNNAELLCQDFETTINLSQTNDFLFCDPPYSVLNEDNRFVSYNADLFSWDDQIRLSNALQKAMHRGVKIIMTNVEHPAVRTLYENIPGFELNTVQRQCFISGASKGRKIYEELIVSANMDY